MSLEINNNYSYDEEEELLLTSNEEPSINHEQSSDTDSSDELNANETVAECDLDQQQQQQQQQQHHQYQQNCLAAAQMMQLMNSNNAATSSALSCAGPATLTTENEKENIPICKFCSKIFANFSNLNHHISAIHLNQSKWVCSQCGKICSSKSNLKVHLRVHLRVKPYHCRWCTYSCMHHSSIRDHLAKVHPDKTHTPLQPGYLFNSHAVPEPEVFNAKGFNVNTFVTDSKMKRSSREMDSSSPDLNKKQSKKTRLNNETSSKIKHEQQQQQQQQNDFSSPTSANNSQVNTPMSNLYNAYAMARMFPFMYNPMQMQYAAAAALANTNHQTSSAASTNFLNMLNQGLIDQTANNSLHNNDLNLNNNNYNNNYTVNNNNNTNNVYNSSSNSAESSDEHPNNTSSLSYSTSSRSSSLSPAHNKNKLTANSSTTTDDSAYKSETSSSSTVKSGNTSARNIFSVDQMLGGQNNSVTNSNNTVAIKVTRETQTEFSCINCSHCSNSLLI